MNIIVRMPNWIGDLVMATPVLLDLRKQFPDARITAMCQTPLGELLEEEPAIDEIFSFAKPSNLFARREEKRDIIAKIQAGKFDLGILLPNSYSSAWWFWRGGVKRRIGYGRRWLLTDSLGHGAPMHQVDAYKQLLTPLGIPPSATLPRLSFAGGKKIPKRVGINPGAAYGSAKCWLPERFRALAQALVALGLEVVFFGNLQGSELVKTICKGLPVTNLAGATSLKELAHHIQSCALLVTNDSGPMHMAAALGTPVVALFGSTDASRTGPKGASIILDKKVACAPCFKRVCPIDFRCMTQISVDEVVQAVCQLLRMPC